MMKPLFLTLVSFCIVSIVNGSYQPVYEDKRLTEAERAAIEQALPSEAFAEPAQPRRVLVFSATARNRHASIPYGKVALARMGEKTGAYEAVVSDDFENFTPERLETFDAICIFNVTGDFLMPPTAERETYSDEEWAQLQARSDELLGNLFNYLRTNPRGLVGIHSASDACYETAEYGEMIGGYFWGHPWQASQEIVMRVDEPDHALNEGVFDRTEYRFIEEIYQFRPEPYSRANSRVLLSLDVEQSETPKSEMKREDGDYPIAWVKPFGRSRVFYTSLGHRHDIYSNPVILKHYLKGIQFALGDVSGSMVPSSEVGRGYPLAETFEAVIGSTFADLDGYDYGEDEVALDTLAWAVAENSGDEVFRADISRRLIALLNAPDASAAARRLALHHLAALGDATVVPDVVRWSADPEVGDVATLTLHALDARPRAEAAPDKGPNADAWDPEAQRVASYAAGQSSDDVLRSALVDSSDQAFAVIMSSLNSHEVTSAVPVLVAAGPDLPLERRRIVVVTLGQLGDRAAFPAITDWTLADQGLLPEYVFACSRIGGPEALPVLLGALATEPRLAQAGLADTPGIVFTEAMVAELGRADPDQAPALIEALGQRGAVDALPDLLPYLASDDSRTARAAVRAVSQLWSPDSLPAILGRLDLDLTPSSARALSQLLGQIVEDPRSIPFQPQIRSAIEALPEDSRAAFSRVLSATD